MKTRDIINYIKNHAGDPRIDTSLIRKNKEALSNLIQSDKMDLLDSDGELDNFIALIYRIKKDDDNTIKYYLSAIKKGFMMAAKNLALFYFSKNDIEKAEQYIMLADNNTKGTYFEDIRDHDRMIKYYKMAIEEDNIESMFNLGYYYQENGQYQDMLKYYEMAIQKGSSQPMNNLANYYISIGKNDLAVKYYMTAIEKGNSNAMNGLGNYYYSINNIEEAEKYYLMAIRLGNVPSMHNIGILYFNNKKYKKMKIYFMLAIKNNCKKSLDALVEYYETVEQDYEEASLLLINYSN